MRYTVYGIGNKGGYLSTYSAFRSLKRAVEFGYANVREPEFMVIERQRKSSAPINAYFCNDNCMYKSVSFVSGIDPSRSQAEFYKAYHFRTP